MRKEKLRELAVVLTEAIRGSESLDWASKESARTKIRVTVKQLLKNMVIHQIWLYLQQRQFLVRLKCFLKNYNI